MKSTVGSHDQSTHSCVKMQRYTILFFLHSICRLLLSQNMITPRFTIQWVCHHAELNETSAAMIARKTAKLGIFFWEAKSTGCRSTTRKLQEFTAEQFLCHNSFFLFQAGNAQTSCQCLPLYEKLSAHKKKNTSFSSTATS